MKALGTQILKKAFGFAAIIFLSCSIAFAFQMPAWERDPRSNPASSFVSIVALPENPSMLLAATDHKLFESRGETKWKPLWSTRNIKYKIRRLAAFKEIPGSVFVLTEDGLYQGDFPAKKWRKVFGSSAVHNLIFDFVILPEDPDHWFVGSADGLFESDDRGKTWYRLNHLSSHSISSLRYISNRLLAASREQILASDDLDHFRVLFALSPTTIEDENFAQNEAGDQNTLSVESPVQIRELISGESRGLSLLWAATDSGVFESRDRGSTWQRLPAAGLRSTSVQQLIYSERSDSLIAGTSNSVFVYRPAQKNWTELFQGLVHSKIHALTLIEEDKDILVAAAEQGLLRYVLLPDNVIIPGAAPVISIDPRRVELFEQWVQLEPTVQDIQRAAIRYADLSHNKIRRWHFGSRLQAILPTFSFGKDFSKGTSIDLDRGGTSDPDRYIFGPDDIDRGWNASLSWDIGDFIWSSSQTSIDSRSKIMAEYRYELLSEITRIYFERRRLQQDLAINPPPAPQDYAEELLRIEELTALLDAATKGYLSQKLKALAKEHPALVSIWKANTN